MPLYEHACPDHGTFTDLRPFSRSSEAADCPTCGQSCAREISIPHFRTLEKGTRIAMERNEKSAHAPHVCHSGCSHTHKAPKQSAAQPAKLQAYTGPRPWVVEHA